jgi:omega-6 fatty acid desaturase (delta-12 desaturase)
MPKAAERIAGRFDNRGWARTLRPYCRADATAGGYELAITLIPFALAWCLMFLALDHGQGWLYALLLLPAAGLLVRVFIIQHDCGHGAFFPNRRSNDWTGRLSSVLTLTPYYHWRRGHAVHHATSGDLDRRGTGDVMTLTVAEYVARSTWGRLRYRLYRHPAVMFGVGPIYLFVLRNRVPLGFMRAGWKPWFSTMATNLTIAAVIGAMISIVGLGPFLTIHVLIVLLAGAAGVWLFYVQHQFERTHWTRGEGWNVSDAALRGSSYFELPRVLRWFTANIGVHHVHHLASRIPYYRLYEVLEDYPELRGVGRVTLPQSVNSLRLVLWDEEGERLVSFKELCDQL